MLKFVAIIKTDKQTHTFILYTLAQAILSERENNRDKTGCKLQLRAAEMLGTN